MKEFTTEELRTLVWMCQCQAAKVALGDLDKGKKPADDPTHQRILAISKKAYGELIERNNKTKHA